MPRSHELSRTAAALGTSLALLILSLTGAATPANAALGDTGLRTPIKAPADSSAGASTTPGTDSTSETSTAEADGSASADPDSGDSSEAGSSSDSDDSNEAGTSGSEASDPTLNPDPNCNPEDTPPEGEPCKPATDPLPARWDPNSKTLQVPNMPDSWAGQTFAGPSEDRGVNVPMSDGASADTDDSGHSVAAAAAAPPSSYALDSEGNVVDAADRSKPYTFEGFTEDPEWTFTVSDDRELIASGKPYEGSDSSAETDSSTDGTSSTTSGGSDSSSSTTGTDSSTADSQADAGETDSAGSTDSSSSGTSSDTSTDDSSSNGITASDSSSSSSTSTGDTSTSDAEAKDSSDSDQEKDGTSDSTSKSGDDDTKGSDDTKGTDDAEGSDEGSGSSDRGRGGNGSQAVPDPATGNGSADTRNSIPRDVGSDWVPPGEGSSPPPDYSDPVPKSPDSSMPTDDTDLITGGNQPAPRGNTTPSTSFGESIISTIVSSWPVFVLAAFGMAAVGVILFLVGRRGKRS